MSRVYQNKQLGNGQAWADVAASRSIGVTYTNTTGRTIAVCFANGSNSTSCFGYVDGAEVAAATKLSGSVVPMFFLVPNGSTYQIDGGTILDWRELR